MNSTVSRVTIHGVQMIGADRQFNLKGRVGADIFTNNGRFRVRINDFAGVPLKPAINPGNWEQSFVEGPVLDKAAELIDDHRIWTRLELWQPEPFDFNAMKGFEYRPTDVLALATLSQGGQWQKASLVPVGEFLIHPAACVLHYGLGIFEGLKAYQSEKGGIVLFRPRENARRAVAGAKRLGLFPVPEDLFVDTVERVVKANERFIPPPGKGSLYVRPFLFGSGIRLGVRPAEENTFIVFVSPEGDYFGGLSSGIRLKASELHHRAAPGGTGNIKAIGNYAGGMMPVAEAKGQGFDELLYLDAQTGQNVEEAGTANVFFVTRDETLITPGLSGTILPGITRDSVITVAFRQLNLRVEDQKSVTINQALQAREAFCTGTAAVISPIASVTQGQQTITYNQGLPGPVTKQLYEIITGIQEERLPDPYDWVYHIA